MQSNTTVAKVNTKGQLVLPGAYRKKLGIMPESQVEIRLENTSISIAPIIGVISALTSEDSFTSVLRDTQGSWGAGAKLKISKDIEKTASQEAKETKW